MSDKTRDSFISNIQVGNIVAFKIGENMYSGKIESISNAEEVTFTIKTKNCSVYYVGKHDIIWVKNGSRWPVGIFNALKESKK